MKTLTARKEELALSSRQLMRMCARHYVQHIRRGWEKEARFWLLSAVYHRNTGLELLTGNVANTPAQLEELDAMIRQMAAA